MFTDGERVELIEKLVAVLNAEKAGQEAKRAALATLLADATREFLAGKYKAGGKKGPKMGVVTLRDTLRDINRKM